MSSKSKICEHCGNKYKGEYLTVGKCQCTVCKKWKNREEFGKRLDIPKGIVSHCKECNRLRSNRYSAKVALAKLQAKKLIEENPTTD